MAYVVCYRMTYAVCYRNRNTPRDMVRFCCRVTGHAVTKEVAEIPKAAAATKPPTPTKPALLAPKPVAAAKAKAKEDIAAEDAAEDAAVVAAKPATTAKVSSFTTASPSNLDLNHAPYILYGVKYIDSVSLAPSPPKGSTEKQPAASPQTAAKIGRAQVG